jgi:hypothetical protein
MKFLFTIFNHNEMGRRSLEDVIGIMGHQIRALGHESVYDPTNETLLGADNGINVIVEGFTPQMAYAVKRLKEMGGRYIILATEEPTPKGFNYGTSPEMVWRQTIFPQAAKSSEGILHLVPGDHVTEWFSQFAPSAYADLGYAPSLMRLDNTVPDHEFGFYGSLTPRRKRILKHLARMFPNNPKVIRIMADFKTQKERDDSMRRAKIILQVRKFESMGLVSSSRCSTALSIGRPVLAEPHLLSAPWNEVIKFSSTLDGFYNVALMMLGRWKDEYTTQFERFKTKMSPEICVGRALHAIGLLDENRQRAVA